MTTSYSSNGRPAPSLVVVVALTIALPFIETTSSHLRPHVVFGQSLSPLSSCSGVPEIDVSEEQFRECDMSPVRVGISAGCLIPRLNVIYIVMTSAPESEWMNNVSRASLDFIASSSKIVTRVGVIRYDQSVRQSLEPTADFATARTWLGRAKRDSNPESYNVGPAVDKALSLLASERAKAISENIALHDAIVLFFTAKNRRDGSNQRQEVLGAAQKIHQAGVPLLAACPASPRGPLYFCTLTEEMAKSPELYTDAGDPDKLPQMVERIVEDAANVPSIAELMLTNNLPPMLEYVAGSADVPPEAVSTQPSGTQLTWRWDRSGVARPLTVTYHVRPIAEGTGTITGTLTISQTDGVRTGVDFASNPLSSTGPCVTPSAEPTASRTPAPSPTPTPPPTLAPSDTPRPSPVPPRPPLFLPIALHERCLPDVRRVDVVLAIDASSSMTEPASGGRTKLAVALDAARVFLDQLHFERGDQAAVVAFNAGATLRVPLVSDQGRLAEALHDIQTAEQTCLACAVEVAAGELAGPRHVAGHTAAIVLLTDGRSNPRPASDAVERARATKAAGVVIFSIGLGSDLDDAALGEMASRRAYFYHAPQAEDLADIYRQIAVDLPCAGEPAGPRQ